MTLAKKFARGFVEGWRKSWNGEGVATWQWCVMSVVWWEWINGRLW